MAERAKSRFRVKLEQFDDGDSVFVEATYFDNLSQPIESRYSTLLGKKYVSGTIKHSTSTSYFIEFEDGSSSTIAKSKVKRVMDNTETVNFDISVNLPRNDSQPQPQPTIPTTLAPANDPSLPTSEADILIHQEANSVIQSEVNSIVESEVNSHVEVGQEDRNEISEVVVASAANISTPTSAVTDEKNSQPSGKSDAPENKSRSDIVTPKQRKRRKIPDSATQIRTKKMKKCVNEDKHVLLSDALEECDEISDDEIDVVLLPPDNVDGDTDNECGNESELTDITLSKIAEVSGTIEINTSRKVTRWQNEKI